MSFGNFYGKAKQQTSLQAYFIWNLLLLAKQGTWPLTVGLVTASATEDDGLLQTTQQVHNES